MIKLFRSTISFSNIIFLATFVGQHLALYSSGRKHNTEIKILAQGDNQVICTFYKLSETHSDEVICKHIEEIQEDNRKIMEEIRRSTLEIGLKIKEVAT